ncbi:MAG: RNA methyltransferase [Lachnospiraceae bacterium]|nr:RNA methyltransferase [Lachnospiraceae bacterium]
MPNIIEITNFEAPELDVYARLSEVQLLRYYEPKCGLFITESAKVIGRALDAGYEPISFLAERKQIDGEAGEVIARCGEIPVYTANFEVLTKLTGYNLTRGALCVMRRKEMPDVRKICEGARRIAILENVVNPTNVGAIFRSAAALNMDAVLLTSACSDPLYRRAARVSMGTVFQVPWTWIGGRGCEWSGQGMELLHEMGFKTAAMALCDNSLNIDAPELMAEEKLAIVLGTEGEGLMPKTIESCDYTVRIPMSHGVDSLNVAAASAVAFWQLGQRK